MKQIIHSNKYDVLVLDKINGTRNKQKQRTQRAKWPKLTYVGKETRFVTKLFKNTNIKIAFTTNNNIGRLLSRQHTYNRNKYEKCGIYQITCPACNKKYIGQTDRPFHVRFRKHFRDYKYDNNNSKFAQHLVEKEHSFGPMESVMNTIHVVNKGRMLHTLERFCIYRETKCGK